MGKSSLSLKIYIGLVLLLALLGATNAFLPQGDYAPTAAQQQLPASRPVIALVSAATMLFLYGGLGLLGLWLSQKLGFAAIWDPGVTNRQRFLVPGLIGAGVGVAFIVLDRLFSLFHSVGPLPHPPFPTSLVASASAGIGEEIIFRLFFIPFWMWILSALLGGRWPNAVFWFVTTLSALAFAAGHLPGIMFILGAETISALPVPLLLEIFVLNGLVSFAAAYYFRKFGFLAAVGIHFWTDIVWHVLYGLLS